LSTAIEISAYLQSIRLFKIAKVGVAASAHIAQGGRAMQLLKFCLFRWFRGFSEQIRVRIDEPPCATDRARCNPRKETAITHIPCKMTSKFDRRTHNIEFR
jgi:hypothetical protein